MRDKGKTVGYGREGTTVVFYEGPSGTRAHAAMQHWALTGCLRAELLLNGQLHDCRGVPALDPRLDENMMIFSEKRG